MNPILILEGAIAAGNMVHKLASDFGLLDGDEKKQAANLVRSELERNISVLQNIVAGKDMTEADLVPPKGIDELLTDAGLDAVVERNKHLHEDGESEL